MIKFLLLIDCYGRFNTSSESSLKSKSMDYKLIAERLHTLGCTVLCMKFEEVEFDKSYSEYFVIYQSSENDMNYHDFIEDILLFLHLSGAILLPSFPLFRAHHNKAFLEILRHQLSNTKFKSIVSNVYSDAQFAIENCDFQYPVVIKTASGAGSSGVFLANNSSQFRHLIFRASREIKLTSFSSFINLVYDFLRSILEEMPSYRGIHHKKIVIQNYISGLVGDYKVLRFGSKFFSAFRENRPNDFRASGSMRIRAVPDDIIIPLLNFAREFSMQFEYPMISIDIGHNDEGFHIIEFQFVPVGTYVFHSSEHYYEYYAGIWHKKDMKLILEILYSDTIYEFVKRISTKKIDYRNSM